MCYIDVYFVGCQRQYSERHGVGIFRFAESAFHVMLKLRIFVDSSLLRSDAVSLGEWFTVSRLFMVPSKRREPLAQLHSVTS